MEISSLYIDTQHNDLYQTSLPQRAVDIAHFDPKFLNSLQGCNVRVVDAQERIVEIQIDNTCLSLLKSVI